MALINNAVCAICGSPYRVCQSCQNIKSFTPWRTVTDTLPHYVIYSILWDYTNKKDKVKAKEELNKCDLSELETFDEDVKRVIKEIMSEDKTTKVSVKKQQKLLNNNE